MIEDSLGGGEDKLIFMLSVAITKDKYRGYSYVNLELGPRILRISLLVRISLIYTKKWLGSGMISLYLRYPYRKDPYSQVLLYI